MYKNGYKGKLRTKIPREFPPDHFGMRRMILPDNITHPNKIRFQELPHQSRQQLVLPPIKKKYTVPQTDSPLHWPQKNSVLNPERYGAPRHVSAREQLGYRSMLRFGKVGRRTNRQTGYQQKLQLLGTPHTHLLIALIDDCSCTNNEFKPSQEQAQKASVPDTDEWNFHFLFVGME